MTRENADSTRDAAAEDRREGERVDRVGTAARQKPDRAEGEADGAALTSGKAAEAIERATAAVGSDEDEAS